MHYTIYQITNLVNCKTYIGAHKTNDLEDDYMGSGKVLQRAIEKYGIENFSKEILADFSSAEEMFNAESKLVNEDFVNRRDTYNIKKGGFGGWDYVNGAGINNSNENCKKGGLTRHISLNEWGASISEGQMKSKKRFNGSLVVKEKYPNGTFFNKKHSDETIIKMKQSHKGKHTGPANSQYGTMWITNGTVNKKIMKTDSIPSGFSKGRTVKNK